MTGKLHHTQPANNASFVFTADNAQKAQAIIARYPAGRQQSAVMPLLALAQHQSGGWLPKPAMDAVADMLGVVPVRVYEVASFYTMYNLQPVGRNVINVCTTTPCWLRGSDAIVKACEEHLGIQCGGTTADGQFTLRQVECLGACVNAPMAQFVNEAGEYYYEDLSPENVTRLIDLFDRDEQPQPGPQSGRRSSEPADMADLQAGSK